MLAYIRRYRAAEAGEEKSKRSLDGVGGSQKAVGKYGIRGRNSMQGRRKLITNA